MLHYIPPSVVIPVADGQELEFRGLNVGDVDYVFARHGADLMKVFEGEVDPMRLMTIAPSLAADIIACASGDRTATEAASRIPFPLAVALLSEIYKLTFQDIDLGNAVRLILAAMQDRAKQQSQTVPTSSGESGETPAS